MDSGTRTLVLKYHEQLAGEVTEQTEALHTLQQDQAVQYLSKFHKFELLDSVFTEFLTTNQWRGQHLKLEELGASSSKRFLRYTHYSIPYLATVFTHQGAGEDWLNIKLCNDGFQYTAKEGVEFHRHGNIPGWVALPEHKFLPYLAGLQTAVKPMYATIQGFYNFSAQRMDLKLYPRGSTTPHLLVTFEPGYADMDTTMPRYSI